jgi:hypothetical protein
MPKCQVAPLVFFAVFYILVEYSSVRWNFFFEKI